jgi:mRNA-degrading endonuclease RelE of RelBE toxin-antitoxin system
MTVEWKPQARADLRRIPRDQALAILHAITRFGQTKQGDVVRLAEERFQGALRLRVGDWRVHVRQQESGLLVILRVLHRSQAYR